MKYTLTWSSIIEAMVVLLLLITGIVWVYSLMFSSQRLAVSTWLRIEAIQIARDGLEAMTNIRDTNWIRFGGDVKNCWNTLNYNSNCIWNQAGATYIEHSGTQWIRISTTSDNTFFIWIQSHWGNDSYLDSNYRSLFAVSKDARWFYTQNITPNYGVWSPITPFFTREIRIDYLNNANVSQGPNARTHPKMRITAIVQWQDPATSNPQRLEMSTILTNWKDRN